MSLPGWLMQTSRGRTETKEPGSGASLSTEAPLPLILWACIEGGEFTPTSTTSAGSLHTELK